MIHLWEREREKKNRLQIDHRKMADNGIKVRTAAGLGITEVNETTNWSFWNLIPIYTSFHGDSAVKNSACNDWDVGNEGLIPGSGRAPGERNGNPIQYSYLGNPIDREALSTGLQESDKTQP